MNPTLFDTLPTHGRSRATDPATSVESARKDRRGITAAILELFAQGGDYTADEASWILEARGIYGPTVVSAFSRLKPRIVATGERRKTRNGVWAEVYRLAGEQS